MRQRRYCLLSVILVGVLFFTSCTGTEVVTDTNDRDTIGFLHGKVTLRLEKGVDTITLAGTSVYSEGTSYKTVTDTGGNFALPLGIGTHTLVFSREGFVGYKWYNFAFAAPGDFALFNQYDRPMELAPIPMLKFRNFISLLDTANRRLELEFDVENTSNHGWNFISLLNPQVIATISKTDPSLEPITPITTQESSLYTLNGGRKKINVWLGELWKDHEPDEKLYVFIQTHFRTDEPVGYYWDPIIKKDSTYLGEKSEVITFTLP